ncbi:hypothetical protein [Vibrio parahaemolyticus]|nr:hypothetical protein [Vibrio parahaemolyticus]BDP36915.1 hypothetical protein VA208B3_32860 [Vibrio alginolyticus]MCR9662667.1 hypothetical protein [Vibrio parahaemolyticus]MCR9677136.1 hypothetical protein [Vibrio parahaemolyticus]MDF4947702.1 hypothetical protein [Vibrio parahaemolyticus]MDF4986122.1 hypothetical protein [Vibrio parahaemolyticus]
MTGKPSQYQIYMSVKIALIGVAFMALLVASARGQPTEGSDDDRN